MVVKSFQGVPICLRALDSKDDVAAISTAPLKRYVGGLKKSAVRILRNIQTWKFEVPSRVVTLYKTITLWFVCAWIA